MASICLGIQWTVSNWPKSGKSRGWRGWSHCWYDTSRVQSSFLSSTSFCKICQLCTHLLIKKEQKLCLTSVINKQILLDLLLDVCEDVIVSVKYYMSHFAYACKMRCPLNLVLENSEYLCFYWTFCIVILDYGLKLHKLSNHTLVILQKWLEIH